MKQKMGMVFLTMMLGAGMGLQARGLSEPVIVAQTQLYPTREQARGYLGRYPTQPLLVEPDLPADPNPDGIDPIGGWGKFPGQADYDYTIKLIKAYDLDGLATFGGRHPRTFLSGETCPTHDYVQLPMFIWSGTSKKVMQKIMSGLETTVKAPHNLMIDGKIVLSSYATSATPEVFAQIRRKIVERFGDRFLFFVTPGDLYKPRYEMWETGSVSAATREKMKEGVRAWLRVADGIGIGGTSVVTKWRKSERVQMIDYVRIMYETMASVRAEPEFKDKLILGSAINGHMNAYMRGYNCLEDCTRTYRETFALPIEYGCDIIQIPEWDEYNENTAIMPTLYSSWTMRRLTRYFVAKAKKRPLTPIEGDDLSKPNLVVSYRKCLSPGEHLVIEVLNVPDGSRKGEVKVAVEITDENGAVFAKYGPSRLDETKMCEARYEVDSAALAAKARAPRVVLTYEKDGAKTVVADGLHPIDLAPANTWNHNAVKQAIRDQLRLTRTDLALKDGRFTASVAADEPIRFAMLCGNGCIQYVQGKPGSAVERFRDSGDDWAVFQISPVCVGRHDLSGRYGKEAKKKGSGKREEGTGNRYAMSVHDVPEAEWLYVNSVTKGERLELDDINEHATPPIFLRVPKAKIPGLKLKIDYLKMFKGEVPLDIAYGKTSYSVGQSIKSMQVTVTRFPLQARYPSVADSKEVSFSVPVDADRDTMTYHAQLVGMSGRVWYSKPFVVEKPGSRRMMRLWNAAKDAAETISLPSARIPKLVYDFAPGRGNVIVPASGERHWFGMLGGPYSSATLWNRGARTEGAVDKPCAVFLNTCDDSCPKRVQEPDGSWSLEFDGVDDFANIPCETWPTFGGATVEMDVMRSEGQAKHGTLWANMFGFFDLGIEPDGTLTLGFWGRGDVRTQKGGHLESGKWAHLKVVNDCRTISLFVDGEKAISTPISMPASNTMGVMLGGFSVRGLGFFKGRMRNLSVDQGGSAANETAKWQAKIDAACAAGGGRVVVPAGEHPVAELELKSNVTLELAEGSRLTAVHDYSLYRWQKGLKAELQRTGVVVAYGATNIALVGKGVIDGGGGREEKSVKRPVRWRNVYFEDCRGVRVEGVRLENPAFWTCFLRRCDGVHVKGVTIRSTANYNNDGLDLCVSNALIEDCDIISEDDAIVMKSFDPDWVSEKVEIRNCRVSSNASYIKFGTETDGVLRDFDIHDCELVARSASFWRQNVGKASWPGLTDPRHGTGGLVFLMADGGILENVRVRGITMKKGVCVPLVFRLGRRRGMANWERTALRGITLERIRMTEPALCAVGNFISGVPGLDVSDVTIRDSSFKMQALATSLDWKGLFFLENEPTNPGAGIFRSPMPAHFLYVRHARNIRLENVTVEVSGGDDARPAVVSDDAGAITLRGCAFEAVERVPGAPADLSEEFPIAGLIRPNAKRDLSLDPEWRKRYRTFRSTKDDSIQPFYWYDPGKDEAVPLVVALHSWGASCHWNTPVRGVWEYCKKNGWAMAYPNFRGPNVRPEACGSDLAVQDILDTIAWAKNVRKIDADRVYIIGGSGGGYMTLLMAGRHPEVFAGAAAFCPITDLARWHADSTLRKNHYADNIAAACGGRPGECLAECQKRSPLTYLCNARANKLPVYIVTGIHDGHTGSVPVGHSIRAFNVLSDEADRISEADIAFIEANEKIPETRQFKGTDPFYGLKSRVLLRATSANARLTVFEGGHDGNYPAGLDFLSRQRRWRPADMTIPEGAARTEIESITK